MENTYILGLSFNTRLTGLAVLNGYSLIDYQVRLNKEQWSVTKLQKIITSLQSWCAPYSIKYAVVSIPYAHYQTKEMETLFQAVLAFFEQKNVTVRSYTVPEIFSRRNIKTKKKKATLQETITGMFPELESLLAKERSNTSPYYSKLFEAVGAAMHQLQFGVE